MTLIFDLLTSKLMCESHHRWGTFIPNFGTLGLGFSSYSVCTRRTGGRIDRRTDGRTDRRKQSLRPLPYMRGHKKSNCVRIGPSNDNVCAKFVTTIVYPGHLRSWSMRQFFRIGPRIDCHKGVFFWSDLSSLDGFLGWENWRISISKWRSTSGGSAIDKISDLFFV